MSLRSDFHPIILCFYWQLFMIINIITLSLRSYPGIFFFTSFYLYTLYLFFSFDYSTFLLLFLNCVQHFPLFIRQNLSSYNKFIVIHPPFPHQRINLILISIFPMSLNFLESTFLILLSFLKLKAINQPFHFKSQINS